MFATKEYVKSLMSKVFKAKKDSFTPRGTIISFMGNTAPEGYFVCDGAEYNISDYPEFAQYLEEQFGSASYFGGDGTTTFAVPDLRGEFLRGSGTATRDSGSGANVGVHQNGTSLINYGAQYNGIIYQPSKAKNDTTTSNSVSSANIDKITSTVNYKFDHRFTSVVDSKNLMATFSTRPTNTSVLYCIKY